MVGVAIQLMALSLASHWACHCLTMQAQQQLRAQAHRKWAACGWARPTRKALVCQASSPSTAKGRVVFLGTPDVAALVLRELVEASRKPDAIFEVVGVVSQPGKPRGRGNKSTPLPTPVEEAATHLGLASSLLSPASARDPTFLDAITALQPDLCITAAYGNMLPQKFLNIPRLGTLNIHPSLLPKYRGAAPVQRCVEAGDVIGGVSVAYTVLACDAGPVLAQRQEPLDPNMQAPELLPHLFQLGTRVLLAHLPDVLAGKGQAQAQPQDESQVTHAAKLLKDESQLDFSLNATMLHNKVRALAGWPGTVASLALEEDGAGAPQMLDLRVVRTLAPSPADRDMYLSQQLTQPGSEVAWAPDGTNDMLMPCGAWDTHGSSEFSVLRVTQVQPPTKKAMAAKDFRNGVRQKRVLVVRAGRQVDTSTQGRTAGSPALAAS